MFRNLLNSLKQTFPKFFRAVFTLRDWAITIPARSKLSTLQKIDAEIGQQKQKIEAQVSEFKKKYEADFKKLQEQVDAQKKSAQERAKKQYVDPSKSPADKK